MATPRAYTNEVRETLITQILRFRDDPDIGDFYAEYYLVPLLRIHGDDLHVLSDHRLHIEYIRAPLISGFMRIGLLSPGKFWSISEMPPERLAEYRTYCEWLCDELRRVDFDNPPDWLKAIV